jgi:outer membrane autotransporter protein
MSTKTVAVADMMRFSRRAEFARGCIRSALRCVAVWMGLVFGAVSPLALAQPACPTAIVSGNMQDLTPGIASAPLVFRLTTTAAEAPPPVVFDLAIAGDAVFTATGGTTRSITVPWTLVSGNLFEAVGSTVTVVSGNIGGPIAVGVGTITCASSPPTVFTLFGLGASAAGTIVPLAGDGATVAPGGQVTLRATVDFGNGAGANRAPEGQGTLDFRIVSGDGRFSNGSTSIAAAVDNNQASVVLTAGNTEGVIRVEASSPGLTPYVFTVNVVQRVTASPVSGDGQTGRPGGPGQPLVLQVLDPTGAPVPDQPVNWAVAFGVGPQLDATTTTTDAQGRTQNTFVFGPQTGESIIVATLPTGATVRFRVVSALGGITVASGNGQTGVVGSVADAPIVFEVSDTAGRPAVGELVRFTVLTGSAVLDAGSDVVNELGRATARFRYGDSPGPVAIQGSAFGGQFTAIATVRAFGSSPTAASGNNQSAAPGTPLSQPLVVQLAQSTASNPKGLAGVVVTWTVTAGGGRLASATSITDAGGRATNQLTLGPTAGANTVRADIPGGGSVVFSATGAVDPAAGASTFEIASGNNQSLPTATPSAPLVVRVRNAAGAAVAGASVSWRVTPGANGTANPTTSTTNAAGEASTVVTLGLPGATQVIATIPGAQGVQALTFTLNGGIQNIAGLGAGQRQVGGAIDRACPALFQASQAGGISAAQQDLLARCSELVGNAGGRPEDVRRALSQMLNDETVAQADAALTTTGAQFDNLKARIAALRSGARGASLGGLALAGDGGALPLSFLPSSVVGDSDDGGAEAGAEFSRWGFFASGTIGRGDRDDASDTPGYEFDTRGLTAGVDYRYSDQLVFGAALGYNRNDTDVNGDQGRLETSGYSASFYGTWYQGDAWYADAVLTFGRNSYDVSRRIRYQIGTGASAVAVDQTATGSPDGTQTQFALSGGRDFNRGAWTFGPYARATLTRIDFDGYTERMSNPGGPGSGLAMMVDSRDLKSLEGVVGGKASYAMSTSWGILMPHVQVEWLHEFEDDPEAIATRFLNDPTGTAILVTQDAIDKDYLNLGIGLSGVFANGRSAFLYYERRAGERDYTQDSLALGVRIEF